MVDQKQQTSEQDSSVPERDEVGSQAAAENAAEEEMAGGTDVRCRRKPRRRRGGTGQVPG